MPDADKIHSKLAYRHQKTYSELYEGVMELDEIANNQLRTFKKDVQGYGDAPVILICQVAALVIDSIPNEPLLRLSIDWKKLNTQIDELARNVSFQNETYKRGINLAINACKQHLLALKQGERSENHKITIISRYLWKVYEAEFESPILSTDHPEFIQMRLEALRQHMKPGVAKYAEQIARTDSTCRMRKPPRRKKCIGLYDDLLRVQ